MSYANKIEIVQSALTRFGEKSITSLEDGSVPSQIIGKNYEGIAERRLAMHHWTFASYPVSLVFQSENDIGEHKYGYVYPPEAIKLHWVGIGRQRLTDYSVHNDLILSPIKADLEALVSHRAPENTWSPEFAEAFVKEIVALLTQSIGKNPELASQMQNRVELEFRSALASDKRQKSGMKPRVDGSLVRAWRGNNGKE